MYYSLSNCKDCISKLDELNKSEITQDDVLLKQELGRYIYFAPVGNQFNFGIFADGKTPRVIVMGITTSPSARDNFIRDLNDLRREGCSSFDALSISCIKNTFNSDRGQLQKVLSKILNGTGILQLIGCTNDIEFNRDFFRNHYNSENYKKVVNNIYFTQMIMCASCKGMDGSRAPYYLRELGDFQKGCIESQLNFINSFEEQVDLLISFGRINKEIIERLDTKEVIKNKCKHHVNIDHPTTKGWNKIDLMHLSREEYIERIDKEIGSNNGGYKTNLINCYDQYRKIKNIMDGILSS